MSKVTKRSCLDLIKEKELPYTIQRIGGLDRLVSNTAGSDGRKESIPTISWKHLYEKLQTLSGGVTS